MHRNGRGDSSRTRRRGNARRKQCVGFVAAVLVIYIVYRSFLPDSNGTKFESYKSNKISQTSLVQGELRNQVPKTEKPFNPRPDISRSEAVEGIMIEDDDANPSEKRKYTDEVPVEGVLSEHLVDRYHLVKSNVNETNQKDRAQDNTTSIKSNNTSPLESAHPRNPSSSQNNITLTGNLTKSNLTFNRVSAERMDPFLLHKKGIAKTSNTSYIQGVEADKGVYNGTVNDNVEDYKLQISDDLAADTKQLITLIKETLTKNGTFSLKFNSQNKTNLDENITNVVESFPVKAQYVLSLAKAILTVRNGTVSVNQDMMKLNVTQLEKVFSMESQYIINIANEVFSKTNNTGVGENYGVGEKLLDKYSSHVQTLRKFASNLLANKTAQVIKTQQKLLNIELPKGNKLPTEVSNVTGLNTG